MEKKKIGKRIIEKGNGEKGEGEKGKRRGKGRCAPAATAGAVGHAWRAARGRWGTRRRRERKKGEEKKEGRDSRRPVTTRRVGWDRDGMRIEFGCRVIQERLWGLGFWV